MRPSRLLAAVLIVSATAAFAAGPLPSGGEQGNVALVPSAAEAAAALDRPDRAPAKPFAGCEGVDSIASAQSAFGLRVLKEHLAAGQDEPNVLLSPLSLAIALQMLANGADDGTWQPLLQSMCLHGHSVRDVNSFNAGMLAALRDAGAGAEFTTANSVWTPEGSYPPSPRLVEAVEQTYGGRFSTFDLADRSGSAELINGWVSKATKERIPQLVESDDFHPDLVMMLINALTFDGTWKTEFDLGQTRDDHEFTRADGSTVAVPMMFETAQFDFGMRELGSGVMTGVRLPYGESGRFAMHVLVPGDGFTAADIIDWLDADSWQGWRAGYHSTDVTVGLPRMEVAHTSGLLDTMKALGMPVSSYHGLFDPPPRQPPYIELIRQKTWMKVDEQGTEAAAATVIGVGILAGADSGPYVVADRPFVIILDDSKTEAMLFAGVIGDPAAS